MLKKIFSCTAFVCLLCACSGIPKEREVTVSDVDISGFIGPYVKVVDGTYKFTNDGTDGTISVKLELTAKPDVKYRNVGILQLNALNENGEIFDTGALKFESTDWTKLEHLLKGNIGDTKTISFTRKYITDEPVCKSIFTMATSFEIIDRMFESPNDEIMSESSSKSSATSDSKKWDKILDEYEKYVDSYAKLIKKASSGDVSAMTESAKMLEHAQNLDEKFKDAKGDMSASQLKRYMEITTKMATSAMP